MKQHPARRALDVDALWKIERIGAPALSPDGRHAVVTVTTPSMAENRSGSSLWLLTSLKFRSHSAKFRCRIKHLA